MTNLSEKDLHALVLMADSFTKIRYISSRCHYNISDKDKLAIISDLADSSHNIPAIIANNEQESLKFLMESNTERLELSLNNLESHLKDLSIKESSNIKTTESKKFPLTYEETTLVFGILILGLVGIAVYLYIFN